MSLIPLQGLSGLPDGPYRASEEIPGALSILPLTSEGGRGFFSVVWEVCKIAFGAFLCLGLVLEVVNFVTRLVRWVKGEPEKTEDPAVAKESPAEPALTAEKAKGLFLSGVNVVGNVGAALNWAHSCEWLDLGSAQGPITFIGYPVTFITSSFGAVQDIREIVDLAKSEGDPAYKRKMATTILRLVSKIAKIAYAVLGVLAVFLALPALSGAGFLCLFGSLMLQGIIFAINKTAELHTSKGDVDNEESLATA